MLSNLKISTKTVKVAHPKHSSFVLELAYVPREVMADIRKAHESIKYDPVSRNRQTTVDTDAFLADYVMKAIKGWSGLTFGILKKFVPIETDKTDSDVIPYSPEDALWIVQNSPDFDSWFSDTMNDIELFTKEEKEEAKKA